MVVILGMFIKQRNKETPQESKRPTGQAQKQKNEEIGGICGVSSERSRIKEQNKLKILELTKQKDKVTNNDVEKFLNVSDATATNYLDELEKEGKVKQVGETGQSVYYELTNG